MPTARESLFHEDYDTTAELVAQYDQELARLEHGFEAAFDPAITPIAAQLRNHLKHVSYEFRIAGNSDDYPYDLQREHAYPAQPTAWALERVDRFSNFIDLPQSPLEPTIHFDAELGVTARQEQTAIVRSMLDHPLETYDDFTARRSESHNASFPEMGWTVKALASDMSNMPSVQLACEKSPVLNNWRDRMLKKLDASITEGVFGYTDTLHLIEDTMGFFDVVVRVNEPDSPPPYHTARFEYNWHALSEDADLTVLPTMTSLTLTDLIRLRGVPIGLLGVSTDTLTVDGFPQTPYEFFHHDVDHTRRMHQETIAAIEREGMTPRQYAEQATAVMQKLLPMIDLDAVGEITTDEQQQEYDRRAARMLVLFEVLHEDGYDATPDSIADAILRAPMEHAPFERELEDKVIEYYTGPRASLLAHVYRKLAHTFYDLPDKRSTSLGSDFARTRLTIAEAAVDLYRTVSDDPISDEDLLATCRELVSTDEGFTDAFIGNFAHDIRRRAVGRDALRLMVSRPLSVNAAVRKINRLGKDVHSLFGYSALEYENPDQLEATVLHDLERYDPDETMIAIGATPYGIGRLYPAVKDLGFYTLGIVASTALGLNEECAEGVDEVVVVRDTNWGGYRYSEETRGLLSPTTRVFLGASNSIAAYGGGGITAVTLEEARRRGKPVTFTPFEMNHRIANMLQAQRGDNSPIDYVGPAHRSWFGVMLDS